jgi:hypothetical protein
MSHGLVVAFIGPDGRTEKLGKVAKWGRHGAQVLTKGGTTYQVPCGRMLELGVPLLKSNGIPFALRRGVHVRARAGRAVHSGTVERVDGDEIIVRLTSEPGRGQRGLLYRHEIVGLVDDEAS